MPVSTKEKILIGLGVGIGVSALGGLYCWYRKKTLNAYPKVWKRVGTLSSIAYCPIKSCEVIKLTEATCSTLGIHEGPLRDHMFMLVDEQGKVVTTRTYPLMMKISQVLSGNILNVTSDNMNPLEIDLRSLGSEPTIQANIFGQTVSVVECGEKYNAWFSLCIRNKETGLRLVYYPYVEPTKVIVDKLWMNGVFMNDDTGTLHDCSSYMLINEPSVHDLNTRLERPVTADQFRPNFIVVNDGPAYAEDHWKWIKIGDEVVFRAVFPCHRCIVPNINPVTAQRDPDFEPLKTLQTYRCNHTSKSPIMGVQLGLRTPGTVRLQDDVYVGA